MKKTLTESILENLKDSPKFVDDSYIIENIFNNKRISNTILESYKKILKYMNKDNIKSSLKKCIENDIYIYTLDEINDYILKIINSPEYIGTNDYKFRYYASKSLAKYVPAIKDLKEFLFKRFMKETITNNMTEEQRIKEYQYIIRNSDREISYDNLGEEELQKIAFDIWLSTIRIINFC